MKFQVIFEGKPATFQQLHKNVVKQIVSDIYNCLYEYYGNKYWKTNNEFFLNVADRFMLNKMDLEGF